VLNVHTLLTDIARLISVDIFSGKGEAYYAEHFTISRYSSRFKDLMTISNASKEFDFMVNKSNQKLSREYGNTWASYCGLM
jgi:hypothetical protein